MKEIKIKRILDYGNRSSVDAKTMRSDINVLIEEVIQRLEKEYPCTDTLLEIEIIS